MRKIKLLAATAIVAFAIGPAFAAKDPMVGGAAMYPNRNIVQNAMHSKDHTTLVAAVKAGGLVKTLEGPGPFTVFAPTNQAFDALPAGTVQNLLKPENKGELDKFSPTMLFPVASILQFWTKTSKEAAAKRSSRRLRAER